MGKMQMEKGAKFERFVANHFKDRGYSEARRSAQHCGKTGDAPDVIGIPGIHIECKAVEQMRLYEWYSQAVRDASASEDRNLPVVIHKQNNKPVLVTMGFDDWIELYNKWVKGCDTPGEDPAKETV